ncbi:Formin-1 [Merluccius polli]|uniref:Formin-1 n=1 Tax=Merluccius polli TaxID=89951 RepID=A0AA47MIC6_MERPO|nr:Formin-1 [Merluccius polli]
MKRRDAASRGERQADGQNSFLCSPPNPFPLCGHHALSWGASVIRLSAMMEGTHTVLLLYPPVLELSHIRLYLPERRAPGFTYRSRAPLWGRPCNDRDQAEEDLAESKQSGHSSSGSSDEPLLDSPPRTTKEAAAELGWLAVRHRQLLANLLLLCGDCASRVRMGNQEGKLQDYLDGYEVDLTDPALANSNYKHLLAVAAENKKAASKGKKFKKLTGNKKSDGVEVDATAGKMKRKGRRRSSTAEPLPAVPEREDRSFGSQALVSEEVPCDGSYASQATNPIRSLEEVLMEEDLHADVGWMEDNHAFDPQLDFCNNLSELDSDFCLGLQSHPGGPMDGLSRRESGSNLRPLKRPDSDGDEDLSPGAKTAHQLYGEIHQRDAGLTVVAKLQDADGTVRRVATRGASGAGVQPQTYGEWREATKGHGGSIGRRSGTKHADGLRLPLSRAADGHSPLAPHAKKSPLSPSLAGVFNASFPSSGNLQMVSPALSPLSAAAAAAAAQQAGPPPLNHRILLLSDKDLSADGEGSLRGDEPEVAAETVDKNGNKQSATRPDPGLGRRPSASAMGNSVIHCPTTTTTEEPEVESGRVSDQSGAVDPKFSSTVGSQEHSAAN